MRAPVGASVRQQIIVPELDTSHVIIRSLPVAAITHVKWFNVDPTAHLQASAWSSKGTCVCVCVVHMLCVCVSVCVCSPCVRLTITHTLHT